MRKLCELTSFFSEKELKRIADASAWLAKLTRLDGIEKNLII